MPEGQGLDVSPDGSFIYISNGSQESSSGHDDKRGIDCIIRIGTQEVLSAAPAAWNMYE